MRFREKQYLVEEAPLHGGWWAHPRVKHHVSFTAAEKAGAQRNTVKIHRPNISDKVY